jgi:hypothetical protein
MSLETLTSEQSCWYTRVTARAVEPPVTRVYASSQYILGVLWDSILGKKFDKIIKYKKYLES